jgi:membrane-associated phospholipid phosphatase
MLYGGLTGRRLTPVLVPPMLLSRLVLGVHYPTDVLAGSALGAAVGVAVRRLFRRQKER